MKPVSIFSGRVRVYQGHERFDVGVIDAEIGLIIEQGRIIKIHRDKVVVTTPKGSEISVRRPTISFSLAVRQHKIYTALYDGKLRQRKWRRRL